MPNKLASVFANYKSISKGSCTLMSSLLLCKLNVELSLTKMTNLQYAIVYGVWNILHFTRGSPET